MTSGIKDNLLGAKFGRLTVESMADPHVTPNGSRKTRWNCVCSCGGKATVYAQALKNGNTQSCGCLAVDRNGQRTHGMSKSATYSSWQAMRGRCENENNSHYKNYGGRGIRVCARWHSFENFLEDMGERPAGHSIERHDISLGYEPGNCSWIPSRMQSMNTTRSVKITWNGETKNQCEWANQIGITPRALAIRIERWGIERAMTEKVRNQSKKSNNES